MPPRTKVVGTEHLTSYNLGGWKFAHDSIFSALPGLVDIIRLIHPDVLLSTDIVSRPTPPQPFQHHP